MHQMQEISAKADEYTAVKYCTHPRQLPTCCQMGFDQTLTNH